MTSDLAERDCYSAAPNTKEYNTDRLKEIEPALRSLFSEFLPGSFLEENVSFWLEVQDLECNFSSMCSAIASGGHPSTRRSTSGQAATEKLHESIIQMAYMSIFS